MTGLLNIPIQVEKDLTPELLKKLSNDGKGLSFPDDKGVQLRVVRGKKTHGGYYSFKKCGGVLNAVKMAVSRSDQLRLLPVKEKTKPQPRWKEKYDKRRDLTEFSYQVFYKVNGVTKNKSFSFGYHRPSTLKQLHGLRTAQLFLFYVNELGDEIEKFYPLFLKWKDRCLYVKGHPFFEWDKI